MTTKLNLLILCLCVIFTVNSQRSKSPQNLPEFAYTFSSPYNVVDARTKKYFSKDGSILSVKFHGKKCVLQKFDGNNNLNQTIVNEYTDFEEGFVEEDILEVDDHFYIFYSVWNRSENKEQLYYRELDFEDCVFKSAGIKVFESTGKVVGGFGAGIGAGANEAFGFTMTFGNIVKKFRFKVSNDKSMILASYKEVPEKKIDKINFDEIGLCIFSNTMEELYRQVIKMPVVESKIRINDYALDKNGDVYILAEIYHKGSKKRKFTYVFKKPKYDVELLQIKQGNPDVFRKKIELSNRVLTSYGLFNDTTNNELYIAGYFANQQWKMDRVSNGMFYCKIEDGGISRITNSEIPLSAKNLFIKKRFQKKNTRRNNRGKQVNLTNLKPKELLFEGNSVILIGEHEYVVVTRTSGAGVGGIGGIGTTSTEYYSRNILVTKVENSGKMIWANQIPKYQIGGEAVGGMGYKYISGPDGYYFLFLDNKKNAKLKEDKFPYKHYDKLGGYLVVYKLDDLKGEATRATILNTRKVKGYSLNQFAISRMVETYPGQFALECYKKDKEDVLIKIQLGEPDGEEVE